MRQTSITRKRSLGCADAVFYHQALSVGIFPYVLKLLQSSARELRPLLVFIWAKILAVDSVSNFRSRDPRSRWGQPCLSYSPPTKTCPSLYQLLSCLSVFCVSLSPVL